MRNSGGITNFSRQIQVFLYFNEDKKEVPDFLDWIINLFILRKNKIQLCSEKYPENMELFVYKNDLEDVSKKVPRRGRKYKSRDFDYPESYDKKDCLEKFRRDIARIWKLCIDNAYCELLDRELIRLFNSLNKR